MPETSNPKIAIEHVPYPMWIYDCETLAFLDVNPAAMEVYGFSREEFLQMTVLDIRPSEDVPKFLRDNNPPHQSTAEERRHRRKDGIIFPVRITSWTLTFEGRPAELVLARREDEKISKRPGPDNEGHSSLGLAEEPA